MDLRLLWDETVSCEIPPTCPNIMSCFKKPSNAIKGILVIWVFAATVRVGADIQSAKRRGKTTGYSSEAHDVRICTVR